MKSSNHSSKNVTKSPLMNTPTTESKRETINLFSSPASKVMGPIYDSREDWDEDNISETSVNSDNWNSDFEVPNLHHENKMNDSSLHQPTYSKMKERDIISSPYQRRSSNDESPLSTNKHSPTTLQADHEQESVIKPAMTITLASKLTRLEGKQRNLKEDRGFHITGIETDLPIQRSELQQSKSSPRIINFGTDSTTPLPTKGHPIPSSIARQRMLQKLNHGEKVDVLKQKSSHSKYKPPRTAPAEWRRGKRAPKKQSPVNKTNSYQIVSSKESTVYPTLRTIKLNEQRSQTSLFGKMTSTPHVFATKSRLLQDKQPTSQVGFGIIGNSITDQKSPSNLVQSTVVQGKLCITRSLPSEANQASSPKVEEKTYPRSMKEKSKKMSPQPDKLSNSTNRSSNPLVMDDSLRKAGEHLMEVFTYKQYQKVISNFANSIELPTLGIKLVVDKKEHQYNLLHRKPKRANHGTPYSSDSDLDDTTTIETRSTMRPWSGIRF